MGQVLEEADGTRVQSPLSLPKLELQGAPFPTAAFLAVG